MPQLVRCLDSADILVLTPFRAQRSLLRKTLKGAGFPKVEVNTVHKAQGSERHTVIFDPVDGDSGFLKTADARRMMNVAVSRAKARFLLLMAPRDYANPVLAEIAVAIDPSKGKRGSDTLASLRREKEYPQSAVGKVIEHMGSKIILSGISPDRRFFLCKDLLTRTTRRVPIQ